MARSFYYVSCFALTIIWAGLWMMKASDLRITTTPPVIPSLQHETTSCSPAPTVVYTTTVTTTQTISETVSIPQTTSSIPDDPTVLQLPSIATQDQLALSPFPAKLWQKAGPKGIDGERRSDIMSWKTTNPHLRHEIFMDDSADQYVRETFAHFPRLVDLYLSLQVPILKADLLRQLILLAEGGIWSDLDVTCLRPIDTWIPKEYRSKTNVVVGLEFDGWQFASWTVMAKPRTSHLAAVVRYVIAQLEKAAAVNQTTIAGLTMQSISDVVDVTGPQAMTVAILDNLSKEMGVPVGRENITNLYHPVLLQDVLVLPNAAFAALQGGMPQDRGPYLVEHHYAGSWKNQDGGETVSELL